MARNLFGPGLRGEIAEEIQRALLAAGHDPNGIDGFYGKDTLAAVASFQQLKSLPVTGLVDEATWQALLQKPVPGTERRSLWVTATIEGHGYSLALGNWDGAWLTWGIVGFTMKYGGVQRIILSLQASFPHLLEEAFGEKTEELLRIMRASTGEQRRWADSITVANRLAEPWRSGFAHLGSFSEAQQEQRRLARDEYFLPAQRTARSLSLTSELALALCFDIQVQNGGIKPEVRQALAGRSGLREPELREVIANAVADTARPTFREDVRIRKLAIARGQGVVHGHKLVLENWGLSEEPAPELA